MGTPEKVMRLDMTVGADSPGTAQYSDGKFHDVKQLDLLPNNWMQCWRDPQSTAACQINRIDVLVPLPVTPVNCSQSKHLFLSVDERVKRPRWPHERRALSGC